ncbi:MAG: metal-dependent transcriptional regulator [Actinomycetaceae bacterium]|nr:metal-dependent transcriptional regulator [Actinomycetaceae bacterium]
MSDLIDTTEMYLKTIYELEEDGVTPMRARIVERLGHSGPTVSQTIARMERDGLVVVASDRRLELTEDGRRIATEVVRKHRLAELLLLDVIGLDWALVNDEACRWEHVMSDLVEERLEKILPDAERDPYGNPIPGRGEPDAKEVSIAQLRVDYGEDVVSDVKLARIGEPIQANRTLIGLFADENLRRGSVICVKFEGRDCYLERCAEGEEDDFSLLLPDWAENHLFVTRS